MRKTIKEFVSIVNNNFEIKEPIYEFGSFQVAGQEDISDLRVLFPGKTYIGADMRPGNGVDVILNLHAIDLPDSTAASVLCLDTLEHVEYPHKAMEEIHRVLRPGGLVVISSVMNFPIHDYPSDYWRFTPSAFESLLKPFTASYVSYAGWERFPHTVVGLGFKGYSPDLGDFPRKVEFWRNRQVPSRPGRLKRFLKSLVPPIIKRAF